MSPEIAWHHMMIEQDEWPHVFGRPTDCCCEPEVDILSGVDELVSHRVVRHQDMRGKTVGEVKYV